MEKDNLNENPWGRKLTDEQMMQEDELIFQDVFHALLCTCLMTLRSQRILNEPDKTELHADAERISKRSGRCYEELIDLFTDYIQSTFRETSILETDPFGKWIEKLDSILETFMKPLQKRYDRLLQKDGVADIADDLESEILFMATENSVTGIHLWILAILSYIELYETGEEAAGELLDNMQENGKLSKRLRKVDKLTDDFDDLKEGLIIAMFDYAMTDYDLENPISVEQEEEIQDTLIERAHEATEKCGEVRSLLGLDNERDDNQ
jgi:hypothetical protein